LHQELRTSPTVSRVAERETTGPSWVAARDLQHVIYPQFLASTEWSAHSLSWKAAAGHLRRLTDWRQKDGRHVLIGAGRRRSNI
jgi:hypothetical protein